MKIEDIRPSDLVLNQKSAYQEDVDRYKNQLNSFQYRNCPGCNSPLSLPFSKHREFQFSRCSACFTVFMNPGPTESIVSDLYANSANYAYWAKEVYPRTRSMRRQTLHKERAHFVLGVAENLPHKGILRVLEIGAGTGDSMAVLIQESNIEIDGYVIEPNPDMRGALNENGCNVVSSLDEIHGQKFDLIIAYEVLEHILDPRAFMKVFKGFVSDNGFLLFSTPNAHSIEVQLLGDASTTLDIEHISVLTPSAIHSIAAFANLEVVEITTPGNFDLELISSELSDRFENFNLENSSDLQNFIKQSCISSHMKVVLRPIHT
jgi:2-polyprenyl-3-methyl-5-hydroxy-6-metoxy-1,4-benzoquinol methylase